MLHSPNYDQLLKKIETKNIVECGVNETSNLNKIDLEEKYLDLKKLNQNLVVEAPEDSDDSDYSESSESSDSSDSDSNETDSHDDSSHQGRCKGDSEEWYPSD